MRTVDASLIVSVVRELCIKANYGVRPDIERALRMAEKREKGLARFALKKILENIHIAKREHIPLCQDTGMALIFLRAGQELRIKGNLESAVNEGVRQGYKKGYLRKSVVINPLGEYINSGDNTPAVIHTEIVPGNRLKIIVFPKGFGSENASVLKMFTPADGIEAVKNFILKTVRAKGADACPPLIIGVGIGGTFEKCAELAKRALLRPIGIENKNSLVASFEKQLLKGINSLGIGPSGFGGKTTALTVNIETFPTHIAGLPVAVNISCWALRQASAVL